AGVVVETEILIAGPGPVHLPDDHQHGPLEGNEGFGGAATAGDTSVFRPQIAAVGAPSDRECRNTEASLQMRIAGSGLGRFHPAGGLMTARADTGPGGEMLSSWKAGRAPPGLGQPHIRRGLRR